MGFSSLPRSTLTVLILVIFLLIGWMIWGSIHYPETLWAPGDLSRHHARVSSCNDCHTPFQGPTPGKCSVCHSDRQFTERSSPSVADFHRLALKEVRPCKSCHTEHRGASEQITVAAMTNPHGEFVFRATGTRSCTACHDFSAGFDANLKVLDNLIVRRLMAEGEGMHRPGKMKQCLDCHKGGRLEMDAEEDDD